MLAVAATCLVAALVAAPTAGAASASKASANPTAKASVTKKRLARDIRTVRRRANRNRRNIISLTATLSGLGTELRNAISGGDKTIDDKINGLVTVVTPILTRLGEAALALEANLRKAGEGLVALEAGLKELAAGTTKLGDFVQADEYGILQIAVPDNAASNPDDANTAPDPVPGCFYVTSNIPDNVQPANLSGQCSLQGVDLGAQLLFLAGIRSNENDGEDTADDDTGAAGIVWYEQRAANGDLAGAGATPQPGAGQPPVVPIPVGSPPTSTTETTFPFGPISTDVLVNIADASTFQGAPDPPVAAATGNTVNFTLRFLDITPNADDPEA